MTGDEEKERQDEVEKQRWIALVRVGDAARKALDTYWPGWERDTPAAPEEGCCPPRPKRGAAHE